MCEDRGVGGKKAGRKRGVRSERERQEGRLLWSIWSSMILGAAYVEHTDLFVDIYEGSK